MLYIHVCSLYFLGLGILTALYQSTHLKVATSVCCELIRGETGCRLLSFEPRCLDLTALKPFISNYWRQDRTFTACLWRTIQRICCLLIEFTLSLMRFLICSEFWFLVYSGGERRFVVYPDQLVLWAPVYRLNDLLAHSFHLYTRYMYIQHHIQFPLEYEILKPQCIHHL